MSVDLIRKSEHPVQIHTEPISSSPKSKANMNLDKFFKSFQKTDMIHSIVSNLQQNSLYDPPVRKQPTLSKSSSSLNSSNNSSSSCCSLSDSRSNLNDSSSSESENSHETRSHTHPPRILRGISLPIRPRSLKCRVSFADSNGGNLTRVRVISESTEDPPTFLLGRFSKKGYQSPSSSSGFDEEYDSEFSDSDNETDSNPYSLRPFSSPRGSAKDLSKLAEMIRGLQTKHEYSSDPRRSNSLPLNLHTNSSTGASRKNSNDTTNFIKSKPSTRKFQPCFIQPIQNTATLLKTLDTQFVSLERAIVSSGSFRGTIIVRNICFSKKVYIRYTTDNWANTKDRPAFWRRSNLDQTQDTFEFDIALWDDDNFEKISFCVQFVAGSNTYWDSNNGNDYKFQKVNLNNLSNMMKS